MRIKFKRVEQVSSVLLFLAISAFIFLKADSPDTETTVYYLAGAVILWAVPCFLYVFIRDAVIALRWKKPAFPLPQYEKEDAEMEGMREEMRDGWNNNPSNPASPIYSDWWNIKG